MQKIKTYFKKSKYGTAILKAVGWVSRRVDETLYKIFTNFPLRDNVILFRSTSDFSDSPRVFYDYLIKQGFNQKYRFVWILNNTFPRDYFSLPNVRYVRFTAWHPVIRKDYYYAIAKCFIFTHGFGRMYSRKGQFLIHTTHSASQLKAIKEEGVNWTKGSRDYSLICGPEVVERRKNLLGLSEDHLLILGLPRLDLLFLDNESIRKLIKDYHGERIILTMETFKQSKNLVDSCSEMDVYAINVVHAKDDLISLDAFLKNQNTIMIVKIHPYQDMSFLQFVELENIRFLTNQDLDAKRVQLYELVKNADILLTDYSSIFYDFLLLDRPIGFLLGDMEQYDRGFIDEDPLKDMVGEKLYTLEDLMTFIKEARAGIDRFRDDRKQLRDRVFTYQDGNNCQRLLEWMQGNHIIS